MERADVAALAESNRELLVADPEVLQAPEKYYDQIVEIDLSTLEPHGIRNVRYPKRHRSGRNPPA